MKKLNKVLLASMLAIFLSIGNFNAMASTSHSTTISQEKKEVKGTVLDESGQPLPGVSVSIKGTSDGTNTDIDGKFILSVTPNDILEISFMGMKTQFVKIGNKSTFKIVLIEDRENLDEVVITGYGTKKRNEFTGSVVTVGKEILEAVPMPSVEQVLQGNVAGLSSVSTTGQPGAAQEIKIRGIGSMNASNAPLYVIDGVPVVSGDFSQNSTSANVMAGLSSNDIANVTVLKDASATSVYGARGANGVIVITTKQGKQGKTQFSFSSEIGVNKLTLDKQKSLNTAEWEDLFNEGMLQGKYSKYITSGQFADGRALWIDGFGQPDWDSNINTNWHDVILRDQAKQQQYNFTMKGGNNKTNFFASINHFDQEGVVKNSEFKRTSGMINLNHRANEKLTIQTKLNISSSEQKSLNDGGTFANPMLAKYFLLPIDKAYDEDGNPYLPKGGKMYNGLFNPTYLLDNNFKNTKTTKILGNAQLFYRPIENLKLTSKIGVDYMVLEENEYSNPNHGDGRSCQGRSQGYYGRNFNWVFQNMADYHYEINEDHKLDFKILFEAQKNKYYMLGALAERVASNGLFYMSSYAAPKSANSSFSTWTNASSMINVNYALMSKIFIDGTFRREGSSKFSDDNKYGNFWSVGGSYLLSKESFIENLGLFSELKIRSSYGVNGNSGIASNLYLSRMGYASAYNDYPVMYNIGLQNQALTWEKNTPFNIGVDFVSINGRISGTFEYFHRTTSDLLLSVPLSRTSGHSSVTTNMGEMVNQGYEFTLSTENLKGEFKWSTDFNFTQVENEVTALNKTLDKDGKEVYVDIISGTKRIHVGDNIRTFYMKKWAGVDSDNGDPLWYINGKNGETTNVYKDAKRATQGTSTPKFYGGLTNTFSYKGFTLSAQLNYSLDFKVYDGWASYMLSDGKYTTSYGGYAELVDRWQKPGDKAKNPKTMYGGNKKSNSTSTRYMYDGDFIRLRNLTIGYTIPKSITKKIGLDYVNIYARGTNLYTYVFDDELNFDPETSSTGILDLSLPAMKTITFGVKLNF